MMQSAVSSFPDVRFASPFLDVALVYTRSAYQGRLGTHAFDLVLPPLGLAYLAGALEKEGYSVRIFDAFAESIDDDELVSLLRNKFKIVGFYCNTQNVDSLVQIACRLKATENPPHILLGGPHASAMPVETLEGNPAADGLVFGEGEITMAEATKFILQGRTLQGVRGSVFRDNEKILKNPPREQIKDLDTLAMPAWHLLPVDKYHSFIESGGQKMLHIITSRGCFSDCNYCQSTRLWGPVVRYHSTERVFHEIDHLAKKYEIKFFEFADDIFTKDRRRVKIITEGLRDRRLGWSCSTRIDLLDDDVIRDLKRGNVYHVAIGIETMNTRLLKTINKHMDRGKVVRTLELCKKHDLNVMGLFILGLPTETKEEAEETIAFAAAWDFFLVIYSLFTVYPGTNFWDTLRDSSALEKDFKRYSLATNVTYVEHHRSAREMERLLSKGYLKFYLRPVPLLRILAFVLKNPRHVLTIIFGFLAVFFSLLRGRYRPAEVANPARAF